MKRTIVLILAVFMVLMLCGCEEFDAMHTDHTIETVDAFLKNELIKIAAKEKIEAKLKYQTRVAICLNMNCLQLTSIL